MGTAGRRLLMAAGQANYTATLPFYDLCDSATPPPGVVLQPGQGGSITWDEADGIRVVTAGGVSTSQQWSAYYTPTFLMPASGTLIVEADVLTGSNGQYIYVELFGSSVVTALDGPYARIMLQGGGAISWSPNENGITSPRTVASGARPAPPSGASTVSTFTIPTTSANGTATSAVSGQATLTGTLSNSNAAFPPGRRMGARIWTGSVALVTRVSVTVQP